MTRYIQTDNDLTGNEVARNSGRNRGFGERYDDVPEDDMTVSDVDLCTRKNKTSPENEPSYLLWSKNVF